MAKVHAANINPKFRVSVSKDILDEKIIACTAVRRPLAIPGASDVIGQALSHSSVIAITRKLPILIEYMNTNQVYITYCRAYKSGCKSFQHNGFTFIVEEKEQIPSSTVTIWEFAEKMEDFMKNGKFDTFVHNCHIARYKTMKFYGMRSKNPDSCNHNFFFQGWVDYFKRKPVPSV